MSFSNPIAAIWSVLPWIQDTMHNTPRPDANNMRSALLGLPDELLLKILSMLPFWEVVNVSQTCGRLRAIALAHAKLWQELPEVVVPQLRTLEPFLERSRGLGFDLAVAAIYPGRLTFLCSWMDDHFARLRKLHLHIAGLPEDNITNTHAAAIARLHDTLALPAPLLEDLSITGNWEEPFLGSLRSDILGGVIAPSLRSLELTAFSLDAVCPGLQGVTSVSTSVGALAPKNTAGQNHRVHALFPAILELEIIGISLERAGAIVTRPLARVPAIDAPLTVLQLCWYPDNRGKEEEDVRAAAWLATTITHVRSVVQDGVHWRHVSEAALAPVLNTARMLSIRACGHFAGETWAELELDDPLRGRSRMVHMRRDQAHALLGKFVQRAQRLSIETLVLGTEALSVGLVVDFPGLWNALGQLRRIRIDIKWSSVDADGAFIAPETLASFEPVNNITSVHLYAPFGDEASPGLGRKIDARFVLQLIATVFPNAQNATVTIPPHSLSNDHLLAGYAGCAIEYPSSSG